MTTFKKFSESAEQISDHQAKSQRECVDEFIDRAYPSQSRKILIKFREEVMGFFNRKLSLDSDSVDCLEYVDMQIDSFEGWIKELVRQYLKQIGELQKKQQENDA